MTDAQFFQTFATKHQQFLRQRQLERRLRTIGFNFDFAITDLSIAADDATRAMRAFLIAFRGWRAVSAELGCD